MRDLGVARILEPNWSDFNYIAGLLWLQLDRPELALDSWREVVARPGEAGAALFAEMIQATRRYPAVRETLRAWAGEKRQFLMVFLEDSTPLEFDLEGGRLLAGDPALRTLTVKERSQFFHVWAERDPEAFAAAMQRNPVWLGESWLLLARARAQKGDFRQACRLAQKLGPKPVIPAIQDARPLKDQDREFYLNPTDLLKGLALCQAQTRAGLPAEALATVAKLQNTSKAPFYLWALAAELHTGAGDWEQAWAAWSAFYEGYLAHAPQNQADAPASAKALEQMKLGSEEESSSPADFREGLPRGDGQ